MKIEFQIQNNNLDEIIQEIQKIENVQKVVFLRKETVSPNILDRNPNYQSEFVEVILNIIVPILAEDVYKLLKEEVSKYLKGRNAKNVAIEETTKVNN